MSRLSRDDAPDLTTILAAAIGETADKHRDACDIAHPNSPQATVAVGRAVGDRLTYLLLADSYIIVERCADDPQVLNDPREVKARRICSAPLSGIPKKKTPENERVLASCSAQMRARRHQSGGYWIAKENPQAALQAVTGSLSDVRACTLLSNGASRIVDPYGMTDWPSVLALLSSGGPNQLIRSVRDAEVGIAAAAPDDATVADSTSLQA